MRPMLLLIAFLIACPSPRDDDDSGTDDDDDATAYPDIERWDFDSTAPWFACPGSEDELPKGVQWGTVFDGEDQYFGDPNLRSIEAAATLPTGDFKQVGLWFQLDCPENGLCDHWDRSGSIQMALNPSAAPEDREWLELSRFVTPYRTSMCQFIDVTPLADLLQGEQVFTSWIDTWVGPGHAEGEGWRTTAKLVYWPGEPGGAEVINVSGRRSITSGEVEPEANVDSQFDPITVSIPADATRVEAHLITTGHSFNNTANCAEFCQMRHDVIVNSSIHSWNGWRNDCDQNPVSPQLGTWEYPRNGWCPGTTAVGTVIDITDAVTPGEDATIDGDILLANGFEYDNVQPNALLPYTYWSLKLYAW